MGKLRDKLVGGSDKTFTLSPEQIRTLNEYRHVAQQSLDMMLQQLTSVYLQEVAETKFGYSPGAKLGFKLELDKKQDNITIRED